jgi:hypothetical protein
MKLKTMLAAGAAMVLASQADAATFTMTYTTNVDATSGPAVTTTAIITAVADTYVANLWDVTAITGTRGNQAITGFDDLYNTFYYPAQTASGFSSPTYFDTLFAELVFTTALGSYDLYRNSGDNIWYHEYDGSVGRTINLASFSITQNAVAGVPEPATWGMMIAGFGLMGASLRTRRRSVAFAA